MRLVPALITTTTARTPDIAPERQALLLRQAERVQLATSSLAAKRCGGRGKEGLHLTAVEQIQWARCCEEVQRQICAYKRDSSPLVFRLLKDSGSRLLLHQENRGKWPLWGGRVGKSGQLVGANKLGFIWMEVRAQMLSRTALFHPSPKRSSPLDLIEGPASASASGSEGETKYDSDEILPLVERLKARRQKENAVVSDRPKKRSCR